MSDLTFIGENLNYIIHNGRQLINFSKRKLEYSVISKLQIYQQIPYNFYPVYQISNFIEKSMILDEPSLYAESLEREPRKAKISDLI